MEKKRIGFQTAVHIVSEELDRLRTTAESHHRVAILEVMGRHTGWIAVYGGIASGADAILIPEVPVDVEALCRMIKRRRQAGRPYTIIVAAEGADLGAKALDEDDTHDAFGHAELRKKHVGIYLEKVITEKTGLEARASVPGHIQRGGTPCAYDRNLATAFGVKAIELIQRNKFGRMASLKGNKISSCSLKVAAEGIKTVDMRIYKVAQTFFS